MTPERIEQERLAFEAWMAELYIQPIRRRNE